MDVGFWASRVNPAKQLRAVQASRLTSDGHLVLDEFEDKRAFFPCPFCYVEIEVNILCSHLQNEHCFDLKNAVCPLCATNLGKDMIGHLIAQHTGSLKRTRKSQKSSLWMGTSANLGKELSSFLWSSATARSNLNETSLDPLFSPFLSSIPISDSQYIREDQTLSTDSSVAPISKSDSSFLSDEVQGQDYEARSQSAEFVQQLIGSIIF